MDVGIVEGIVGFGAGGYPAGLPTLGQGEDVIVGATLTRRVGTVRVMVAKRGPQHGLSQHRGIAVSRAEDCILVLAIRAVRVSVIAQHQPQVGVARPGEVQIGIAHGPLAATVGAGVPEDPDAGGFGGPRHRRGKDEIGTIPASDRPGTGADGVVVLGVGRRNAEQDHMFCGQGQGRGTGFTGEAAYRSSITYATVGLRIGPPFHDDAGRRAGLQVGPTRH